MKKILIPILLTIVAVTAVMLIGKSKGWFDRWLTPRTTEVSFETGESEKTSPQEKTTAPEPDTMVVIDPIEGGDVTAAPDTSAPETTPAAPATTEAPQTTEAPETTEAPQTTAAPQTTEDEPQTSGSSERPTSGDGKKYVALTFDDGPDMRYTSSTKRILDILEQYGAKATFFTLASQLDYNGVADENTGETFAQRNAKLIKRASDLGMEIGTHTYNHKNLNTLSTEEIQKELYSAIEKVEAITGKEIQIMRPPYGNANQKVQDAINMPMIIWDVDSLDWESKDPDKIYSRVMSTVQPGSIILMHDIYNTTADGVALVVPALIEKGYTIVTVSELYRIYGKELQPHHVYMAPWYDD
ncbi:MAG: polysaccharide deacetylase family protein [Lachnospiraceae bacterium]|nr:polysaccharide deacetylase family protein [Lachnospiraceae bacterium]